MNLLGPLCALAVHGTISRYKGKYSWALYRTSLAQDIFSQSLNIPIVSFDVVKFYIGYDMNSSQ
jgi:hypothetical protein